MLEIIRKTDRHSKTEQSSHHIAPLEIRAEGFQASNEDRTSRTDHTNTSTPILSNRSEKQSYRQLDKKSTERSEKSSDLKVVGQKNIMEERGHDQGDTTIRLDLETEDGKKQEIFLDDKDLICPHEKEKQESEALAASLQEDAKQRKKELEQILDEHEEIVKTIIRQSSHESNNEAFQATENERHQ